MKIHKLKQAGMAASEVLIVLGLAGTVLGGVMFYKHNQLENARAFVEETRAGLSKTPHYISGQKEKLQMAKSAYDELSQKVGENINISSMIAGNNPNFPFEKFNQNANSSFYNGNLAINSMKVSYENFQLWDKMDKASDTSSDEYDNLYAYIKDEGNQNEAVRAIKRMETKADLPAVSSLKSTTQKLGEVYEEAQVSYVKIKEAVDEKLQNSDFSSNRAMSAFKEETEKELVMIRSEIKKNKSEAETELVKAGKEIEEELNRSRSSLSMFEYSSLKSEAERDIEGAKNELAQEVSSATTSVTNLEDFLNADIESDKEQVDTLVNTASTHSSSWGFFEYYLLYNWMTSGSRTISSGVVGTHSSSNRSARDTDRPASYLANQRLYTPTAYTTGYKKQLRDEVVKETRASLEKANPNDPKVKNWTGGTKLNGQPVNFVKTKNGLTSMEFAGNDNGKSLKNRAGKVSFKMPDMSKIKSMKGNITSKIKAKVSAARSRAAAARNAKLQKSSSSSFKSSRR